MATTAATGHTGSCPATVVSAMGERACDREFRPDCDAQVTIVDEECPDCGRPLDIVD